MFCAPLNDDLLLPLLESVQEGKEKVPPSRDVEGDAYLRRGGNVGLEFLPVDADRQFVHASKDSTAYSLEPDTPFAPQRNSKTAGYPGPEDRAHGA